VSLAVRLKALEAIHPPELGRYEMHFTEAWRCVEAGRCLRRTGCCGREPGSCIPHGERDGHARLQRCDKADHGDQCCYGIVHSLATPERFMRIYVGLCGCY